MPAWASRFSFRMALDTRHPKAIAVTTAASTVPIAM